MLTASGRFSRLGHPETDSSGNPPLSHDECLTAHSVSGCPQVDENMGGEPGDMGAMATGRPAAPLDDLRRRGPMAVEAPRWILWAIVTAAVAYAALSLLTALGTTVPDPCDDFHESPYTALNIGVVAGSIVVSLVAGHRMLARRLLLVPYAAAALQALIWYWLLVIPKGTC